MFDPIALAERFGHDVVEDISAAEKHSRVIDALVAAASAVLPEVKLPEEAEEVVELLRAAGRIVHRAIDRAAPAPVQAPGDAGPTVEPEPAAEPPAPPAGFEEPAPAAEAPPASA